MLSTYFVKTTTREYVTIAKLYKKIIEGMLRWLNKILLSKYIIFINGTCGIPSKQFGAKKMVDSFIGWQN